MIPNTPPRIGSSIDSRDPPSHGPQHRMMSDEEADIQSMPPPASAHTKGRRTGCRNNAKPGGGVPSYDDGNGDEDDAPSLNPPPSTVTRAKVSNMMLELAVDTHTPVASTRRILNPITSTTCESKQPAPNHFSSTSSPTPTPAPTHKHRLRNFNNTQEHNYQEMDRAGAQVPDSNTTCHTTSSTMSSPPGTPFRFTSFPASLPRVNPRTTDTQLKQKSHIRYQQTPLSSGTAKSPFQSPFRNPNTITNTIRKRMTFAECEFEVSDANANDEAIEEDHEGVLGERIRYPAENDEDDESHDGHDESHDTSLSSLSGDGTTNHGKTPGRQLGKQSGFRGIHTPFQLSSGFGGSHEGSGGLQFDAIPESGVTDRAVWLSPILSDEKQNFLDEVAAGGVEIIHGGKDDNDVAMGNGEDEKVPNPRTKLNFNSIFSPSESSDAGARKRHSFIDDCQSPQDGK